MYPKAALSPNRILDILIDAGAVKRSASLSVQSFPGDVDRRRGARRQLHRIWLDGRPHVQLYIAPDLNNLERSAAGFYRACPSIVCKPLFFVNREGLDFLGMEFAEGVNAEEAYRAQALSPDALLQGVTALDAALGHTEEPSTPQAAGEELDGLFHALRESDLLSDPDRSLLGSFIEPKLKSALLAPEPRTRWTNGDFITGNIIVGRGGPKLVDYEFAARTHFYCEDWARLSRYSPSLPASVLELVNVRLAGRRTAFEIYGLLRQMVLENGIKRVAELNRETRNIARQLVPLLDRWRLESSPSVFLPSPADPAVPGNATARVQAFYSTTAQFDESNAIYDDVMEGVWKRVELPLPIGAGSWHIRLDPVHCAGVVEVASVEISAVSGARGESIALPDVTVSGTCAAASVAPVLMLICYGPDPQLHLPVLPIEGHGPLRLAVWMRWERLETGLGRAVTEITRVKTNEISADKAVVRRCEIKIEELTAALDQECLARADSQARFEGLMHERQRIYDGGAVQSLARIRELTASWKEERAARESFERAMAESARAAMERDATSRAEVERARAVHEEALQQERAARAPLEIHAAEAEASVRRCLAQIADLEAQLQGGDRHRRNLETHIASLRTRIAGLERSLSWRITAPGRHVAGLFQGKPDRRPE